MREHGLVPDVISYNAAIAACGESRKLDEAVGVMEELISNGCKPDFATYKILIEALDKGSKRLLRMEQLQHYYNHGVANGVIKHWNRHERDTMDLHRFSVAMSKAAVLHVLEGFVDTGIGSNLNIVTGVGKKSEGGKAVIKPALIEYLRVRT